MNILVACEESQRVCQAFRDKGNIAYSCDVIDSSGGKPEWHIKQDVIPLLNGSCHFKTCDGVEHYQDGKWDMIIAFPPCTYLTAAGAVRLYNSQHQIKDQDRLEQGIRAAAFFKSIYNADCEKICIENPTPMRIFQLPKYNQVIQPYQFGEPWKKRTCLWLKGLPKLQETNVVTPIGYWVGAHGKDKAKEGYISKNRDAAIRSKTFIGVALAMAEQWGSDDNAANQP